MKDALRNRLTDEQRDLVAKNLGLARQIAKRNRSSLIEDDAAQEATIGLMDASRTFNADLGFDFAKYGYGRAWGAILDAERKDCLVRIPRSEQQKPGAQSARRPERISTEERRRDGFDEVIEIPDRRPSVFDEICRREWHERFWERVDTQMKPRSRVILRGIVAGKNDAEIGREIGVCGKAVSAKIPGLLETLKCVMREMEAP